MGIGDSFALVWLKGHRAIMRAHYVCWVFILNTLLTCRMLWLNLRILETLPTIESNFWWDHVATDTKGHDRTVVLQCTQGPTCAPWKNKSVTHSLHFRGYLIEVLTSESTQCLRAATSQLKCGHWQTAKYPSAFLIHLFYTLWINECVHCARSTIGKAPHAKLWQIQARKWSPSQLPMVQNIPSVFIFY